MATEMRVMTSRPLNAETPNTALRNWITDNEFFFKRNQGQIPETPVSLTDWRLQVEGLVGKKLSLTFKDLRRLPKVEAADTLECSGNSRSLLSQKASGNPWTIGGVGNAVWGGIRLRDVLETAGLRENANHVAFEGFDKPMGSAGIKFIRSIPIEKAMSSTLLAYEMNGAPLPVEHGYPLRALALGWTGASCVKWLRRIEVLERAFEGFFMDKVYRVYQKGEDPKSGEVVKEIQVKTIIVEPEKDQILSTGTVPVRGAAYAGEAGIETVEVSVDLGTTWHPAEMIGLDQPFAWRHWEYLWEVDTGGDHTIMARAIDTRGNRQPETAQWNTLGYGNNGVREHAVRVRIEAEVED
ncbi:MAG: sulfite oxidase [Desulfobacterales bacterium]|jgi:DMSO/TMAO reductase YedYZ molybdopterin-dependent catalytic subunit